MLDFWPDGALVLLFFPTLSREYFWFCVELSCLFVERFSFFSEYFIVFC